MKSKALIEVLLPAIFICSVTLIAHFEIDLAHANWGLIAFILCSIFVCRKYKNNVFWRKYWAAFKFPIYLFSLILRLFVVLFSLIYVQFIYVIVFGCILYHLIKYSFYYLNGIYLEFELLFYLSLTITTILLSFKKRYETSANKGIQEAIKKLHKEKSSNVVIQFMNEVSDISNIVTPKYSSEKMRYSIYVFYFILLVLSNVSPYIDGIEVVEMLTDNKAVNGSFLTFFAFDNLFQNRKAINDINKRNVLRVVKVAMARNRSFFYPKDNINVTTEKKII
ncbi:hypothetical protein [Bacteroides sp.]|uniref:hypothetical protein n=1 Tax=Bacteroides sp. TaxID=29523 RepID=UPI003AB4D638